MKIVGLISWFDERPAWLAAGVASLAPFVDHITALDGAYMLYPEGSARSPAGQAEAIRETARACGMGCTIHEPQRAWAGNEVEKRSALFAFGEQACTEDDWYFVLDGDELVTQVGCDVKARCAETAYDVGEVLLWKSREHYTPEERPFSLAKQEQQQIRVMFRAIRGLRVVGNHYTYVTPDGRNLWGKENLEPAEDFTTVHLEHRNKERDLWRNKLAQDYYAHRDQINLEGLTP